MILSKPFRTALSLFNTPARLLATVGLAVALLIGGAESRAEETRVEFDIPAQPMSSALIQFANQSNLRIAASGVDVSKLSTSGVSGRLTPDEALSHLLYGTGLQFQHNGDDAVIIRPGERSSQNKARHQQLAANDSGASAAAAGSVSRAGIDRSASTAAAGKDASRKRIDEVLVTAEKREVNVQRTAVSVAAYTSQHLERSVIEDIYDIGLQTPGLIVNQEIVGKIYIRGIGTENLTIGGDPGVPVHVDGVYLARTSAANLDLYDVERVEVLRGPQGTLYGRNATGGSINIISKAPTNDFYARLDAQYGNHDRFRIGGTLSGPIIEDKVLFRASFVKSDRDGFTPNLFNGEDLDDEDLVMGRMRLKFLVSDDVTFDLIGEFSLDDSKPAPFKQLEFSPLFEGLLGAFDPPGLRPVSQDSPVTQEQDQWGVTGILNWDLGSTVLTSVSAFRSTEFMAQFDGDAVDILFQNFSDTSDSEQFSQEIRLASDGWDRFDWMIGAYYFHDDAMTSIFIPIPGFGFDILHNADMKTDAFAFFGQVTYRATDRLSFTVGLRYSNEDKEASQFSDFGFMPPLMQDLNEDSDALTPRFAIEFFASEDVLLYASVTRGFKSGGFTFNGFQSNFRPEFVWAYEGGVKSQFLDGRLQANVSAFYYDYTDLQVSKLQNQAGVITNAADATIYGGELEVIVQPWEYFSLNAGLAYLHAEFDQFLTEDPSNPALGEIDLAGNRLTRSPRFTANLGAEFIYPVSNLGEISLRADYQYQSKSFFTPFNRALSQQDSFDLFNARLAFRSASEQWQIAVFVKNAFNEEYFLNILESAVEAGKPEGFLASPRTYGVQVIFEL